MRYLIATGGTGGHIYPALALVDEIKKMDTDCSVLFIGSKTRMEAQLIPETGYEFYGINIESTKKGLINKFSSLANMFFAYQECIKIIKSFKPDVVIGFGNYISVPVLMAAHHKNILTVIHEQNSFAGKANRFLSRYADAIVGCYEENLDQFPKHKTKILGNPRATVASKIKKDFQVLKTLGIDSSKPLVVIVMGSLGSESVNVVMKEALADMQNKNYQVVYVTGKSHYDSFKECCSSSRNIFIVPYIDGCQVMVNADLCVVRGGATTAAEITAMGMPSIIIPSPYVPNNHQVMNALALQNQGAAIMIEEKDLSKENIILKIENILSSPIQREAMSKNAKKLAFSNASNDIYDWILKLRDKK